MFALSKITQQHNNKCTGLRVTSYEDLPAKMAEFLAHDGPILLDAKVCKKEHVYPMVGTVV